ncbi:MAG: hypothetical protein CL398_00645 [Acidiferrobacteraceae bacterium]|nr:hypothetical protein [Acidiferrobacteraceae bacterium]|tara:strand:- start:223 stop:1017 length:795 start_codon:yes stop_codon:yes gene_type:complete
MPHPKMLLVLIAASLAALSACNQSGTTTDTGHATITTVPEFRGLTLDQAAELYLTAGFTGKFIAKNSGGCTATTNVGTIYAQTPKPKNVIASDSSLSVSHGCFDITIISSGEGTVTPGGVKNVNGYSMLKLSVLAKKGHIDNIVEFDGVAAQLSGDHPNRYFVIGPIVKAHNFKVTFMDTVSTPGDINTSYVISTSVQSGDCAFSPSGDISVLKGSDQSITITVNSGTLSVLNVDGVAENCAAGGCTYSFSNITSNHTIEAVCS